VAGLTECTRSASPAGSTRSAAAGQDEPFRSPLGSAPGEFLPPGTLELRDLATDTPSTLECSRPGATTVFLFLSQSCPYVLQYVGRLQRLERQGAASGVQFVFVYPTRGVTTASKQAFHRSRFGGLFCADPDAGLARALRISRTPEAVLVDRDGKVLFRGGIDDQPFVPERVERPYLMVALNQHREGVPIRWTSAPSFG
jgi:hypothetical protein